MFRLAFIIASACAAMIEKAGEVKLDFAVEGIGAMHGGGKDMKDMSKPMKH